MVIEEGRHGITKKALFEKIEAIELPKDKDTRDWTEEDWEERFKKVAEETELMAEEEMAEEDGWAALPFAPELQPLSCGVFLVSSVEYSWPGYFPGDEEQKQELCEEFNKISMVVKIVKEGNVWKLKEFLEDAEELLWFGLGDGEMLTGEGDTMVRSGLTSMRILASGELLLIRKSLIPGLDYGGPDFRGASYTLYSPI